MDHLLQFLMMPISGSDTHFIAGAHVWHARLMVIGWGVLIPCGAVVARYFKVTARQDWPRQLDNQAWWITHLVLQIGGCLLSFVAVGIVVASRGDSGAESVSLPALAHVTLGWSIVSLGLAQMLGGAFRGTKGHHRVVLDARLAANLDPSGHRVRSGDHYVMSRRRCLFEYAHKIAGYAGISLAALNILIGLALTDAPVWMWLAIIGFWGGLGLACLRFQREGRCVDTYQAIYGPDDSLPGNLRTPIGWGVRRYRADEWPPGRKPTRAGETFSRLP